MISLHKRYLDLGVWPGISGEILAAKSGQHRQYTTKLTIWSRIAQNGLAEKIRKNKRNFKKLFHVEHFFGAWRVGRMRLLGRVLASARRNCVKKWSVNI